MGCWLLKFSNCFTDISLFDQRCWLMLWKLSLEMDIGSLRNCEVRWSKGMLKLSSATQFHSTFCFLSIVGAQYVLLSLILCCFSIYELQKHRSWFCVVGLGGDYVAELGQCEVHCTGKGMSWDMYDHLLMKALLTLFVLGLFKVSMFWANCFVLAWELVNLLSSSCGGHCTS